MRNQAIIYSIGSISLQLVNFFLLPLFSNQFTTEQFGNLIVYQLIGTGLSWFLGLQIGSGLIRYYYSCNDSERDQYSRSIYSFSFLINISISLLFFIIIKFPLIAENTNNQILILVMSSQFIFFFSKLNLSILRIQKKAVRFVVLNIIQSVVYMTMTTIFVLHFDYGIYSIFYGQIISGIVVLSIFFIGFNYFGYLKLTFKTSYIKKALKFSIPLIPSNLTMWILNSSDHFFIKFIIGTSGVGVYGLSYKIAMIINMALIVPLKQAWAPHSFSNIDNLDLLKIQMNKLIVIFVALGSILLLILSLFISDILVLFAKPEYLEGIKIIFWVGLSYIAMGLSAFTANGFHIVEKTKLLPKYTLIAAISNIILNYFLIKLYGILGAAIATLIAFSIKTFLNVYNLQKYFYVKYSYKLISYLVLVTIFVHFSMELVSKYCSQQYSLFIKFVAVTLTSFLFYYLLRNSKFITFTIAELFLKIKSKIIKTGVWFEVSSKIEPEEFRQIDSRFEIRKVSTADYVQLQRFSERNRSNNHYENHILPRLNQPSHFIGLGCFDRQTNELAYLCWIAFDTIITILKYYKYKVSETEGIILDGFTDIDYRRNGLHQRMMQERINTILDSKYIVAKGVIELSNYKAMENAQKNMNFLFTNYVVTISLFKIGFTISPKSGRFLNK